MTALDVTSVAGEVRQMIRQRTDGRVLDVAVVIAGGVATVRGTAASFYLK